MSMRVKKRVDIMSLYHRHRRQITRLAIGCFNKRPILRLHVKNSAHTSTVEEMEKKQIERPVDPEFWRRLIDLERRVEIRYQIVTGLGMVMGILLLLWATAQAFNLMRTTINRS